MIRLVAALSLLLPGLALAQISMTVNGQSSMTVSTGDCATEVPVTWTLSTAGYVSSDLSFWATTGTCGDAAAAGDVSYDSVSQTTLLTTRSNSFVVKVTDLPMFSSSDGGYCGSVGTNRTVKICAAISIATSSYVAATVTKVSSPPTIVYDTEPPGPPSLDDVVAMDKALIVKFSVATGTTLVRFEVRPQGGTDFTPSESVSGDSTAVTLPGLDNDTTYDVQAVGEDAAGNVSDPSNLISGTPVRSDGFFAVYRRSGGTGNGGCTMAGSGTLAVLGLLAAAGFVFRRRRS
jgi:MYXO-CTERM domain-containing protein